MKTITIRLTNDDYNALKNYASGKRVTMTAVIMQQLDTLGVTKPPTISKDHDKDVALPDDLDFVEE